jgi:hypothetical protein
MYARNDDAGRSPQLTVSPELCLVTRLMRPRPEQPRRAACGPDSAEPLRSCPQFFISFLQRRAQDGTFPE